MKILVEKIEDLSMVLRKVNSRIKNLSAFVLFVHNLNIKGMSVRGEFITYNLLFYLKKTRLVKGNFILNAILKQIKPVVSLKKKKIGGAQYRIPVYLFDKKGTQLAIKWVIQASCGRKLGNRTKILQVELTSILENKGKAVEKKKALYEQALLNRAYIKYL